jgi:tetratricopeptide (TPR) repeat protein
MGKKKELRKFLIIPLLACSFLVLGQNKDSKKANSRIEQAFSLMQQGDYERSRDISEDILKNDSTFCFGYVLLGITYANYATDSTLRHNTVERNLIYCLAIDMFEKAIATNEDCTPQANREIKTFSSYLLSKEEIFIGNVEGEVFMVNGWINRKTTFRYKD